MTIIVKTYEQSRLEFFQSLKAQHERQLKYWLRRIPQTYEDCWRVEDERSYHGAAVQYCEDAIKALGGKRDAE